MKKLLLAGVALASLMTAASAADLAARPYAKAPPLSPALNWSGFYIGAMGGYAFDSADGGGFGGGTIGYNWQVPGSQFVFGIEVDAAGASIKENATGVFGGVLVTAEDKIDAFGSVTGRVGVAANAALFYAKGGYAWMNNKVSATALGVTFSDSQVHSGYTVGGGVEYLFAPNWSVKAEYMYSYFDSQSYNVGGIVFDSGNAEFNSVKVGVNYHFK